jgi:long-chain acyl-CoA synthetase
MILNHKVEKKIKEELDSINSSILEHHEQVKKFKLLADSWTAENGLLTPSLKLRRQAILEKYASDIQTL